MFVSLLNCVRFKIISVSSFLHLRQQCVKFAKCITRQFSNCTCNLLRFRKVFSQISKFRVARIKKIALHRFDSLKSNYLRPRMRQNYHRQKFSTENQASCLFRLIFVFCSNSLLVPSLFSLVIKIVRFYMIETGRCFVLDL